jgi:hypothetical protein
MPRAVQAPRGGLYWQLRSRATPDGAACRRQFGLWYKGLAGACVRAIISKARLAGLLAGLVAAAPAAADTFDDWTVPPYKFTAVGMIGTLSGEASGAVFDSHQSALGGGTNATGYLLLTPQLETVLDNAWELGFRGALLAYHDTLSGDMYGNDVFQKAYGFLQMPYGRIEIGQQDGAGTKLSFTGPTVDDDVSLNDANVSFFRNPATGRALIDVFPMRTQMFASANDAKISYYIPHLTDFQVGFSYTPAAAKGGLPFLDPGPHGPNRATNIFEMAGNYAGYFGNAVFRAYGALALAHNGSATPGHDDLRDWSLGGEVDYTEYWFPMRFAVGGSWRHANTYVFDVEEPFTHGATNVGRLSAAAYRGKWSAGIEYETGKADAHALLPQLNETGYEASVSYQLNFQLQLTAGWQHMRFTRSSGAFYDGLERADGDAFFLHTGFRV